MTQLPGSDEFENLVKKDHYNKTLFLPKNCGIEIVRKAGDFCKRHGYEIIFFEPDEFTSNNKGYITMTESVNPVNILQFFSYEHLPEKLQAVSKPFCDLAKDMTAMLEDNPEKVKMLDKLLEAKDAAVRSRIYKREGN